MTISGGFADHTLRCSKQRDASYLMLTVLGGLTEFERWDAGRGAQRMLSLDREGEGR